KEFTVDDQPFTGKEYIKKLLHDALIEAGLSPEEASEHTELIMSLPLKERSKDPVIRQIYEDLNKTFKELEDRDKLPVSTEEELAGANEEESIDENEDGELLDSAPEIDDVQRQVRNDNSVTTLHRIMKFISQEDAKTYYTSTEKEWLEGISYLHSGK